MEHFGIPGFTSKKYFRNLNHNIMKDETIKVPTEVPAQVPAKVPEELPAEFPEELPAEVPVIEPEIEPILLPKGKSKILPEKNK
jgi:hypothetical protein